MMGQIYLQQLGAISLVVSCAILLFTFILVLCSTPWAVANPAGRQLLGEPQRPKWQVLLPIFWLGQLRQFLIGLFQLKDAADASRMGRGGNDLFLRMAIFGVLGNFVAISVACGNLLYLLSNADLFTRYVVQNSTAELSIFFRITALWAGSAGSLLLWYWMLSLFALVATWQMAKVYPQRLWAFLLILLWVEVIFAVLLVFAADVQPFRVFPQAMASGRGINPLLLHWAMIIHPPILYVGYISTVIPFAILFSGLLTKDQANEKDGILRRWILFSWVFLGVGILLGSKWAYEELGWGGYWAWDPVENASLMPWLIGTALVHSLIVWQRCGKLKLWTYVLAILFYHFSILGTWITRSGVLGGPHTFANSSIGTPLILYIFLSMSLFFSLLVRYRKRISDGKNRAITNLSSKEGSMLINNLLMVFMVAVILLGVFSPLLPLDCRFQFGLFGASEGATSSATSSAASSAASTSSWLTCQSVEWKPSAFNRILIPIGLVTILVMGASPLLTWKRSLSRTKKGVSIYRWPLAIGFISFLAYFLTVSVGAAYSESGLFSGINEGDPLWRFSTISLFFGALTLGLVAFAWVAILMEYYFGVRSRCIRFQENWLVAWLRLLGRNKRRYAGYLFHLSILFLFIGFSGGLFKSTDRISFVYRLLDTPDETKVVYYSGDRGYVDGYEFTAGKLTLSPQFASQQAKDPKDFVIAKSTDFLVGFQNAQYSLETSRLFFPQIEPVTAGVRRDSQLQVVHTATSEPDILSFFSEDLYVQLGSVYELGVQTANLKHLYETYYYIFDHQISSRKNLFPQQLVADLHIWINPLVQFIWLGSILFFVAGIFLLLPVGEPNPTNRKMERPSLAPTNRKRGKSSPTSGNPRPKMLSE